MDMDDFDTFPLCEFPFLKPKNVLIGGIELFYLSIPVAPMKNQSLNHHILKFNNNNIFLGRPFNPTFYIFGF